MRLIEQIMSDGNPAEAAEVVRRNKGAAGVDHVEARDIREYMQEYTKGNPACGTEHDIQAAAGKTSIHPQTGRWTETARNIDSAGQSGPDSSEADP